MKLTKPQVEILAFIKYLYNQALTQSYQPSPFCWYSLLSFQDSVELFLGLACEVKNKHLKDKTTFAEYFDPLEDGNPNKALAEKNSMLKMNRARVALKHHGNPPDRHTIEYCRETVTAFLEKTQRVFSGLILK